MTAAAAGAFTFHGAKMVQGLAAATGGSNNAQASQLPQDAAVSSTPPAALDTNRPVGRSATQNAAKDADVAAAEAAGATDIRVNQQQVNAAGDRVGINRPDLQYTDANGQRVYVEYDTSSSNRAAGHQCRIQANDPDGRVLLKTVD